MHTGANTRLFYKMLKFFHDNNDDNADNAKAIAKSQVFSKNSLTNELCLLTTGLLVSP